MNKLKKIGNRIVYILGLITLVSLIGILSYLIYIKKINPESIDISYYDGPHIFYLNDTIIKAVFIEANERINLNTHEYVVNLNDSTQLHNFAGKLPKGFNPFDSFQYSTNAQYTADKIAAVSDIHGAFHHFSSLLKANKIIDGSSNWSWGNGHLVIVGDVFDKGPYVTECFWLIKKLEDQAKKQGGKVHLLYGNHERLVLSGITDHIGNKYRDISEKLIINYGQIYGSNTYLGRWLRTKNVMIKINNILFTHGGISKKLVDAQLSLEDINKYFNIWVKSEHLMNYDTNTRYNTSLVLGRIGPLEYRGYFNRNIFNRGQSSRFSSQSIKEMLKLYSADRIIVGHTIVKEIQGLFGNTIIAINKEYPRNDIINDESDCQMLIVEGANYFKANSNGERTLLFSDINNDVQQ